MTTRPAPVSNSSPRRRSQSPPTSLAFGSDANLYLTTTADQVLRYDGQTGAFLGAFITDSALDGPVELMFVVPEPGSLMTVICLAICGIIRRRRV